MRVRMGMLGQPVEDWFCEDWFRRRLMPVQRSTDAELALLRRTSEIFTTGGFLPPSPGVSSASATQLRPRKTR